MSQYQWYHEQKYLRIFYLQYQSKSYYIIEQEVDYSIGRFITLSGSYYIIGRFLLHYRAHITVSGVYYIIGWYKGRGTQEQVAYTQRATSRATSAEV